MDAGGSAGAVLIAIRTVAETGSTNADMLALARAGAQEGDWLRAERQVAGRGRLGRAWVSPVGNVYASMIVRLRVTDPQAATLAFVAAVALEETVRVFLGAVDGPAAERAMPVLKWPNDLLLGGAKLSGILLERADDAVVIGIGVNLVDSPDLPDRRTTDLAAHGVSVGPAIFLQTLAETLERWLSRWRAEGFATVSQRWLDRAHPIGTALTARMPDGIALDGLFGGIDPDGALILRLASGEQRVIHAADVFLL